MRSRVYILLEAVNGKSEEVAKTLSHRPGVAMVNVTEGPPDVVALIEASERTALAKSMVNLLSSVADMTCNVQVLPVKPVNRHLSKRIAPNTSKTVLTLASSR